MTVITAFAGALVAALTYWAGAPDTSAREAAAAGATWAPMMLPVWAAGLRLLEGVRLWRRVIIFAPAAAFLHALAAATLADAGAREITLRVAVVLVFVAGLTAFQSWLSAMADPPHPRRARAQPSSSEQR